MMVKNLNHLGVALAAAAAGVLAAVGMLMLMLVLVEPAGAAFPGQNGKIAFVSDYEIYTVNAAGSELERLTNNTVVDKNPAWSPDIGSIPGDNLIAFESMRPDGAGDLQPDRDIYTINPLGIKVGPLTLYPTDRLTNDPASERDPAWSPDGKKIAFSSNRDGKYDGATGECFNALCSYEIYIMNADGTGLPFRLTNRDRSDYQPAWSPDGKKIAFTSILSGHLEIFTMNADGTGLPFRLVNGTEPAWSPDGKKIAFTSDRFGKNEIFTMNVYGEEVDLDGLTNEAPHQSQPDWQSTRPPQVCPVILCPHQGG